jgi:hypothetical protein
MSIDAGIYSLMGDVAPEQEQEQVAVAVAVEQSTSSIATSPLPSPDPPGLSYKTICISMYLDDLAELDSAVKRCQTGGLRKMSKSQLIRIALSRLDVEALITEMRGQR